MTYFCIVGRTTREVLTYQGRVIVHPDRDEMQFLFPMEKIIPLPKLLSQDPIILLKNHPGMSPVRFPLKKYPDQFRK